MDMSETMVISTHGLSKTYKEVVALKSLDLKVPKNSIFGFLGPNGAGKTTTIKLLLGLTCPTSGSGTLFGKDIVRDSVEIRKHVGYLAQNPRFYEYMSAREILRFVARFFYSGPKGEIERRVTETLELVELADKMDRPIKGFSGGELQRLGIAQAQVNYPDLLILDEPAANLDPKGRRDVLEVMEHLRKHSTIFYCTHILDDVQRVSDMVAILNQGELVAQAPIKELLVGREGTVYTVVIKGNPDAAHARVVSQPWVSKINATTAGSQTTWQISVTDEAAAEAQLLQLVQTDKQVMVIEFGRKKYKLEDIFLSIVEGGNNG